ncbi:odorant receptor Or1-like [Arctopsyche grandis]|uniref:odorant receptor Or1-like n=1 Tax=Arctopsyche grandis TaxID=121162 RepID=UPI00406D833A
MKNLKYFPFHYRLLRIAGLGEFHDPHHGNFNNFSKPVYIIYSVIQHIFWTVLFPIALWMEVPRLAGDLDRLTLNLTFSITFVLTYVKLYIIMVKNRDIQQVVYTLEEDFFNFSQSKLISDKTVKMSKCITYSVLIFANSTVVGLIIGGIIQAGWNSTSSSFHTRKFPVPVYLPHEISSDFIYSVTFVYQIFGIVWCGNLVVLINTFINAIMVHVAGRLANLRLVIENIRPICISKLHSRILSKNDFKDEVIMNRDFNIDELVGSVGRGRIERNVLTHYGQDFLDKYMYKCMKECIIHHKSIISCVNKIENIYNIGFLTHAINNLSIICHVMIQITENNFLSIRFGTAIALFFTVVSEFLVQCYAGNELTLQASGLSESAYDCQWYTSNIHFKRMTLILMIRAQKPLKVTAGKFFSISTASFVTIMKGAYSFFAVIRSTKRDLL